MMVCNENRLMCSLRRHWIVLSLAFCSLPASGFQEIDLNAKNNFPGYGHWGFIQTHVNRDNNFSTAVPVRIFQFETTTALTPRSQNLLTLRRHYFPNLNAQPGDPNILEHRSNESLLQAVSARLSFLGRSEIVFGTRIINTPHLESGNRNKSAPLVNGLTASYKLTNALSLSAHYIDETSNRVSRSQSEFPTLTPVSVGDRSGDAGIAAASYDTELLSGQAWYYRMQDVENIFYVELKHSGALSRSIDYKMGVQFDWAKNAAIEGLREVDSQNLGVIGSINWDDVTVFAAHNHELGDTPPVSSLGEGPYFTSMYAQTADAIGDKNARSTSGGFVYTPSLEYLKGLEFGVSGGWFRTADRETYDVIETDYSLNYGFSEGGSVELAYALISDKLSTEDYSQLRIILSYVF